jgi:hypothetical protein
LIVVIDKGLEQEKIGFENIAVVGAAARVNSVVGLRKACGHHFEVLLSFINHKKLSPESFFSPLKSFKSKSADEERRSEFRCLQLPELYWLVRLKSGILPNLFPSRRFTFNAVIETEK